MRDQYGANRALMQSDESEQCSSAYHLEMICCKLPLDYHQLLNVIGSC